MRNSQKEQLQEKIENIVYEKDCSYIDAILMFCEENDMDYESVAKSLTENLRGQIQIEAENLHLIERANTQRLPI